uniref:Peptidase_M1 domain-containing protein n=1 Tax=Macrostomum lignano TaxID=282301 RepID=A0A1I8FE95_9PLAT
MDRCYVEFVASALQTDSLLHSHPIIVPGLSDPNEIESMFDDISYFKGSALIRMLDAVIGRRTLKRGLIIYLNGSPGRNAASSDLFAPFSEGCPGRGHSGKARAPIPLVPERPTRRYGRRVGAAQGGGVGGVALQVLVPGEAAVTREGHGGSPDVSAREAQEELPELAYMLENGDSGPHANSPVRNLTRVMDTWTTQVNYRWSPFEFEATSCTFGRSDSSWCPTLPASGSPTRLGPLRLQVDSPIRYVTDQISEPRWVWMDLEEEKTIEFGSREPKFGESTSTRLGCTGAAMSSPTGRELIRAEQRGYFDSTDVARPPDDAFTLAYRDGGRALVTNKLFKMYQQWRANTSFPRSGLRELVWSYFERNWDIMMERYDMAFTLTEVTKFPAEFHTEYDYQRLSSFFANRDLQSGWRSAYQSLESVKATLTGFAHNLDDFKSFIRQKASWLSIASQRPH